MSESRERSMPAAAAAPAKCALLVLACMLGGCTVTESALAQGSQADLQERVRTLEARLQKMEDIEAIDKLTRAYGYYVDKAQWDQIVDLFDDDSRVEIAGRGVYFGKKGADTIFRKVMGRGQIGLAQGALFNHMILQGIVDVAPDGKTALGRWRAFVQIGQHQQFGMWSEGTYLNKYVKEDGVWKFKDLHFFATFYTPYDAGWAKTALPNNGPSKEFPPDAPQSVQYEVFPGHYVPPYHYPNPVTGEPWKPTGEAAAAAGAK